MGNQTSQVTTIKSFDPEKYEGEWWEIARYPNPSQKDCLRLSSCYHWNGNKEKMKVTNTCWTRDGKSKKTVGHAVMPNPDFSGRLEVKIDGNTSSYWILWTDYNRYSIVGNGNRTRLWILARKKQISSSSLELLKFSVKSFGYNVQNLVISETAVSQKGHDGDDRRDKEYDNKYRDEKIEYYNKEVAESEGLDFWEDTAKASKQPGVFKNKTDYGSDFTEY